MTVICSRIAEFCEYSWAFCKDKCAGEELWQSFLTQRLNFPFLPLWYFTLWDFWQPERREDFKWACSVRTRTEGHFKVHSDNAFSVPPKTPNIFMSLMSFRASVVLLRATFSFFTQMVLSKTGFTHYENLPGQNFPRDMGDPEHTGRRLTKPNKPQWWKQIHYFLQFLLNSFSFKTKYRM